MGSHCSSTIMFGQLIFITLVCATTVNAIPCSRCSADWHCIPYLEHCNPTINATLVKNPRNSATFGDCMRENLINPGGRKISMQNHCQFNVIPLMGIYLVLFMILTCFCCCCCKCCCGSSGKRSSVGGGRGDLVMVRA